MNDWTKLDDAICEHIQSGKGHPTNSTALAEIARESITENKLSAKVAWRVIDRRIQAMKKAGRIELSRRAGSGSRWRVVIPND